MGFLSKMFGQQPQYPELAGDHAAARQLEAIRANLESLSRDVHDPMEVVPADDGAYVFIGKPPKNFGIAWIRDGEIESFKTMMEKHGMSGQEIAKISDQLREVYVRHHDAEHFQTRVADREIVVTPSKPLEQDVRDVLSTLH